jgi:hypothetical protein
MATADLSFSPVVAIDIDGVFRLQNGEGVDGAFQRTVTFRNDNYPDLFHGKPRFDEGGLSVQNEWFSGVGAAWLRDLLDRGITVVLATTWQHWANTYFAEVLGIPELPVAVLTLEPENLNWHHCSAAWKSVQLRRQFDGRPLMWVDDNPTDRPSEDLIEHRRPADRALTRVQKITFWRGIGSSDIEQMNAWLAAATSEEGHGELRAERRRAKAQQAAWHRRWEAGFAKKHQRNTEL